jgi:hypothetical protein
MTKAYDWTPFSAAMAVDEEWECVAVEVPWS